MDKDVRQALDFLKRWRDGYQDLINQGKPGYTLMNVKMRDEYQNCIDLIEELDESALATD